MSTQQLISQALISTLTIDGVSITLTQRGASDPVVYQGTGKIAQDSDGVLRLHMIHVGTVNQLVSQMKADADGLAVLPGTLVPDHRYFDMVCIDTYGNEWTAEKISLDKSHFFFPTNSIVINPVLRSVTRRYEAASSREHSALQFIVPYSVELPCNEFESYGNGGKRLTIFNLTFDDMEITVNNADEKLIISVLMLSALPIDTLSNAVLTGLSILAGRQLSPLIKETREGHLLLTEVKALKKKPAHSLPRLFESTFPLNYDDASAFLNSYIHAYLQDPEKLAEIYGYWHKIFIAKGASQELWALALTTSIEGVIKHYFSALLKHDTAYEKKLDDALTVIQASTIDAEVIKKLQSSLSNFKRKNIAAGLAAYVEDKPLFSHWPGHWSKLRNQSAHADALEESPEKIQIYYDRAFTCLAIFYHLLASTIGYTGKLTAYGTPGWPELPPTQEAGDAIDELAET